MSNGEAKRGKTTLTAAKKGKFIKAFAPVLTQVLRESGQLDVPEADVLASIRDPKTRIEFETPPGPGSVMSACVITEFHFVNGGQVKVVIRRKRS